MELREHIISKERMSQSKVLWWENRMGGKEDSQQLENPDLRGRG